MTELLEHDAQSGRRAAYISVDNTEHQGLVLGKYACFRRAWCVGRGDIDDDGICIR